MTAQTEAGFLFRVEALTKLDIGIPPVASGKVREIFDLGEQLLIVATDRISAFDVIMPNGIPGKGEVLTKLSAFWFERLGHIVPNHFVSVDPQSFPDEVQHARSALAGRSMLVQKAKPLPVECVVRGYLAGSAWRSYRDTGTVFGRTVPRGLRESDRLAEPLFTPTTKAEEGHDLRLPFARVIFQS